MKARLPLGFAFLLAASSLLGGCRKELLCRDGTILVEVTLIGASANATTLNVVVSLDGETRSATATHKAGDSEGGLEIKFEDRYPGGKTAQVTISADVAGEKFSGASMPIKLDGSCARVEVTVGLASTDQSNSDVGLVDLSTGDLSIDTDLGLVMPDLGEGDLELTQEADLAHVDLRPIVSTDLAGVDFAGTISLTVSTDFRGGSTGVVAISATPSQPVADCAAGPCTNQFSSGTQVILLPVPDEGYYFGGWTGDCTGFGSCSITLNGPATVGVILTPANVAFLLKTPLTPTAIASLGTGATGVEKIASGADAACQSEADAALLTGTFAAWLATPSQTASQHFSASAPDSTVPSGWIRPDAKVVAGDVFSGQIFYPLVYEAAGTKYDPLSGKAVMTGSDLYGNQSTAYDCNDWSSFTAGNIMGTDVGNAGGEWNTGFINNCSAAFRLYCFQVDFRAVVRPPTIPGPKRRVFPANPFDTKTGISGADSLCDARAMAAGLSSTVGKFAAVLAPTASTSASSRFTIAAVPVVRTDDVVVASTMTAFLAAPIDWLAAPDVSADGASYGGGFTAIGAPDLVSNGNQNCSNWSVDTGNNLQIISVDRLTPTTLSSDSCGSTSILCLEK